MVMESATALKLLDNMEALLKQAIHETTTLMAMPSMMVKKISTETAWSMRVKPTQPVEKTQVMRITTVYKIGKKTSLAPYGMLRTLTLVALTMVMSKMFLTAQILVTRW